MTLPFSKTSTVKPLTAKERAAWAAYNSAEEKERFARFQSMSFPEKLRVLESQSRMFADMCERREAQRAASDATRAK